MSTLGAGAISAFALMMAPVYARTPTLGELFSDVCFGSAPGFERGESIAQELGFSVSEGGLLRSEELKSTFAIGTPPSDARAVGEGFDLVKVEQDNCVCLMMATGVEPDVIAAEIYGIARDEWPSKFTDWSRLGGLGKVAMEFDEKAVEIAFEQVSIAGVQTIVAFAVSSSECSE